MEKVRPTVKSPLEASLTRRRALQLAGAGLAAPALLGSWREAFAADPEILRILSEDTADVEIAWFKKVNDAYKAKYPDLDLRLDINDTNLTMQKLTTSISANDPPDMMPGTLLDRIATMADLGVLRDVDDIIDAIGRDDFYPGILESFQRDGKQVGVPLSNQAYLFWWRNDLLQQENVKVPTTWDELLTFAKAFTHDGKYGVCLTAGTNLATCHLILTFFRQGGGGLLDEDGKVIIDSAENRKTLDFLKDLFQYVPPGYANYGFSDLLKTFETGLVAGTYYLGRELQRVYANAPDIAPHVGAGIMPQGPTPWNMSGPKGAFILADARNPDGAKRWILEAQQELGNYIDWLLTAPGMYLPVRKSAAADARFTGYPLLQSHPDILQAAITASTTNAGNYLYETTKHKPNFKGGALSASPILPTMLQSFLVNNESADSVLKTAQKAVEDLIANG